MKSPFACPLNFCSMAMTLEWVLNSSGRKLDICVGLGTA